MIVLAYAAAALAAAAIAANAGLYAWRARQLQSLRPCDRPEPLAWGHSAVAFLYECGAAAAAFALLPAGWLRRAMPPAEVDEVDGTVILIHDLGQNAGGFALLRRRLRRSGWQTAAMRHPALLSDATAIAAQLHDLVGEIAKTQPRQIVLVGHGFGGLVARLYARRYRAPLVRRILTLGTPHQGSVLPPVCRRARELLAPGGRLCAQLAAADRVPQQFDVVALYSTFDATVVPPSNAEYVGAFNIQLNDIGHHTLLFSRRVYQLIAENLAAPLR